MTLDLVILCEDFHTQISGATNLGFINIDEDFYYFCKVAHELECDLLATIDPAGITAFNNDQREIIETMLPYLRKRSDIKQSIVEILQKALDICAPEYHVYIVFLGDFDGKIEMIESFSTEWINHDSSNDYTQLH